MPNVKDKVAVVTGGASGIGAGIVKRLLEEGAPVCVSDLKQDITERFARTLQVQGRTIAVPLT